MTKCMRLYGPLSLLALALILGACTEPASREGMGISETQRVNYTNDRYLSEKVIVGNVTGGEETDFPFSSEISSEEFKAALQDSLETAFLLGDRASASYSLDAELIDIDQPGGGWAQTVHSRIRYILRDVKTGEAILDEVIDASGTAWVSDAPTGPKILKIANERSAQSSLKKIVHRLYRYDPSATFDYTPDENRLWSRFEERKRALMTNDYDAWLKIMPTWLVNEAEVADPKGLRSMFDYYATEFEAIEVLELCDCVEVISPQGNRVVRCRTLTRMDPEKGGDAFSVLEMWQYESGDWYWGYTDHHRLSSCLEM